MLSSVKNTNSPKIRAVADIGCIQAKDYDSASFAGATAIANSARINTFFDSLSTTYPTVNELEFDQGYVCLSDTIGTKSGGTYTASNSSGKLLLTGDTHCFFENLTKVRASSTGTLPGNLAVDTDYWVIRVSDYVFKLATSYANASAGSPVAIDYSSAGTGTLTIYQRALPNNFKVTCAGGWSLPLYAFYFFQNLFTSGIIWLGDAQSPPIRASQNGNVVSVNCYRDVFLPGDSPPPTNNRAKCVVEIVQHPSDYAAPCRGGEISVACSGFTEAIAIENRWGGNCDTMTFRRVETYNCLSMIVCNNPQAAGCHLIDGRFYVPPQTAIQTVILDFQLGGRFTCSCLSVVGDRGTTVLRLGSTGGDDDQGRYDFTSINIDKTICNAVNLSNGSTVDNGYLRLIDKTGNRSSSGTMNGIVCHANADLTADNWPNGNHEALFNFTTCTGIQTDDWAINIKGLPDKYT